MRYLEKVQRGINYIEAHLDEDISLQQVASVAGISQWHFQRIFKALTKETLKTYIRCRRMANALDKLMSTDKRILDIAIEAGYDSQESFTRAFKLLFGITPNSYRKIGQYTPFLKKLQIEDDYIHHINQNMQLEPEIITINTLQLVGLSTQYYGSESEKNNLGNKISDLWESFLRRTEEIKYIVPGKGYGVVNQKHGEQLEYLAAFEVNQQAQLANDMTRVVIPERRYACFAHIGKPENLDHTVNYIYSNWLLQTHHQHSYHADIEIYGGEYLPESKESIIYYSIPLSSATQNNLM